MSTATPIKRSPEIAALSRDHHHTLLLSWKIRQGTKRNVETGRIAAYALHFYDTHIKEHFLEEEVLLFSKLPENDELRTRAINEHHQLRALFGSLTGIPVEYEQLLQLGDKLDQHVRFEERTLFPHIEKTFSTEELQQVGLALAGKGVAAPSWDDEFWK